MPARSRCIHTSLVCRNDNFVSEQTLAGRRFPFNWSSFIRFEPLVIDFVKEDSTAYEGGAVQPYRGP